MSIKKIFILFLMITFSISLIGCSSQVDLSKNEELPVLQVMLDWYPNAVHTFLYVAVEKGYFEQEGIQVEFVMPAETNDPLRLVAAGKIDLALSYQPEVISANSREIPVIALASVVNHPLNVLLVPEKSTIQSPKDLEGKQIGYPSIVMNEALVKTMVEHEGGDSSKVGLVDIGWDLMPAISTEKVDAISGGYLNHEEVLLNKQDFKVREFYPTEYGVPDYAELMLVTGEEQWEEKTELIKKFWIAAQQGQNEVIKHPKESLQVLLNQQRSEFPLDEDVESKSLELLLPLMKVENHPFGWQNKKQWTEVQEWMFNYQLIDKKIPTENMYISLTD